MTDHNEMMRLYERLESAKESMGDRYLLHPNNFVKHKYKEDDMARDCNLFSDNSERDTSLLIHVDDLSW